MSQHNITINSNENLIHVGEPKVMCDDYIEFIRDGKVVGTISATFDFSNLPKDLHELGINIVYRPTRVGLPGKEGLKADKKYRERQNERQSLPWWKRWYYDIVDPVYYV